VTRPVCVIGATGATGTRVALLAAEAGLPVVLAGRNRAKLEVLAAELGGAEVRPVDLDRPKTLDAALEGVGVVANCVGPSTLTGRPVAEAAVRSGAHYVDTTGEPVFCLSLVENLDGAARDRGVALVTAAGSSAVPGDFAAACALADARPLGDATSLTLAYRISGMRPSRGTLLSEIEIVAGGAVVMERGILRRVPAGGTPRLLPSGWGTRMPLPDPVVVSRYCTLDSIEAFMVAPAAGLVGRAARAAERVLARPDLRAGLRRLAVRLPETYDGRPHGRFAIDATVWGRFGAVTTTARTSDVYGFTARAVVFLAARLAGGDGVGDGGVRAPSQVVADVGKASVELGITLGHRMTAPGEPVFLRDGGG
jgi:short subunit dehydrogenase-like uncharacterized protein